MKRLTLTALTCALLAVPATASAADSSWVLKDDQPASSLAAKGFAGAAILDNSACGSDGNIKARYRTRGGWTALKAVRRCDGSSLQTPSVTRDAKSKRLFIVWSQRNVLHKSRTGVFMVLSRNGGRSWSKPRLLVKTSINMPPGQVAVAARAKRLWLMRTTPRSAAAQQSRFVLEGFSQVTGRFEKRNLAKSGSYRSNTRSGSLSLHAGDIGLLLVWHRSGGDRVQRTYVAASEHYTDRKSLKRMRLRYEGEFKSPTKLRSRDRLVVGEDDRPYLFSETQSFDLKTKKPTADVIANRWSWVKDQFVPALPARAQALHIPHAPLVGAASFAYQVDRNRSVYIAYQDFSGAQTDGSERTCLSVTGSQCVRSTSPEPAATVLHVSKATLAGQRSRAAVPWPRVSAPPSSRVTQWWEGGSGLDLITTAFGGARLAVQTASSTDSREAERRLTFSDPLAFTPVP